MAVRVRVIAALGAALAAASAVAVIEPGPAATDRGPARRPVTAYVTAYRTSRLDRLDLRTGKLMSPLVVGRPPAELAVAPDQRTAYVLSSYTTVSPVNLVTGRVGAAITPGRGRRGDVRGILFAADGTYAYADVSGLLAVINPTANHVVKRIALPGQGPVRLVVVPHRHTLVALRGSTTTLISTTTNTIIARHRIWGVCALSTPVFSPDGGRMFVLTASGVVAVDTATLALGRPVPAGSCLGDLVSGPGATALYASGVTGGRTTVGKILVSASGLSLGWATAVPRYPESMVLAPGGATLYVGSTLHRYVTPVSTASGKADPAIYASLGTDRLVVGRSGRYLFAARFAFKATAVAVIDTVARRLVRVIHAGGTGLAGLVSSPDGSRVYAIVDTLRNPAGWLLPISASDGRPGRPVVVNGQPAGLVFAR